MSDIKNENMTLNVVNIFDLMKVGGFPRYQDCQILKKPNVNSIVLMVSHRWENKKQPDPKNIQFHGVIRFIIQACMMAMGSSPNVFNSVDFSEVILCPTLFLKLSEIAKNYALSTQSGINLRNDENIYHWCELLLIYLLKTIGEENTQLVANDIHQLAYMMHHFDIWYDYTSLPQFPRSSEQQFYFEQELGKLDYYFSRNYTLILWSKKSLKRAWCFLEGIVSDNSSKQSIFCSENSKIASSKPAPINELFFTISSLRIGGHKIEFSEFSEKFENIMKEKEIIESNILNSYNRLKKKIDLTNELSSKLRYILYRSNLELKEKKESEVLQYLKKEKYKCTDGSDINLIARCLYKHLQS